MKFTPTHTSPDLTRAGIHLASMIDVVFLLLIFFMVSTAFILPESQLTPAIQSQKQNSGTSTADYTPQILTIEIVNATPQYRLGERIITDRSTLTSLLTQLPKDLGILVYVSDYVPVGFTVAALQCCHDAGFEKVTYVPAIS